MADREPAFYWVKRNEGSAWRVGEWSGADWFYCGSEQDYPDNNYKVGPKIEPPVENP